MLIQVNLSFSEQINLRSSNGQETFLVTFNNPPVISLCDNQWHSVDVRVTLIQLELRVDGNNTIATHRMPGSAGGRYSLFAGGISGMLLQPLKPSNILFEKSLITSTTEDALFPQVIIC